MIQLVFALLIAVQAGATEIVFFQGRHLDGSIHQLEPGGSFFHAAIRVGNQWLHAYPGRGVEMINNLATISDGVFVLQNPGGPELKMSDIEGWLGLPFDFSYRWANPNATYCARLIADILNIPPQTMKFAAPIWANQVHPQHIAGELGLSPDDLFIALVKMGYRPRHCTQVLRSIH